MKRVYLAGAINGKTDAECNDWRETATQLLSDRFDVLNPMRRDYRGRELTHACQVVYGDLRDIDLCDVVLARCIYPSWGTAMEIHYAFSLRSKLVVCFTELSEVSPWLRVHCHFLCPHMVEAIDFIRMQ